MRFNATGKSKKIFTKLFSIILSCAMIFTLLPSYALAADRTYSLHMSYYYIGSNGWQKTDYVTKVINKGEFTRDYYNSLFSHEPESPLKDRKITDWVFMKYGQNGAYTADKSDDETYNAYKNKIDTAISNDVYVNEDSFFLYAVYENPQVNDETAVNSSLGFFRALQNDPSLNATEEEKADAKNAETIILASQNPYDGGPHLVGYPENSEGKTIFGDPKDATSLENMKNSLLLLKKGNELRAADNNFPGLSNLKVSSALMAYAQTSANVEAYSYDHYLPDVYPYLLAQNNAENAAWGLPDPYAGWYVAEKNNYDKKNGQETGHYEAIVNSELLSTGLAVSKRNNDTTCTQDFSKTDKGVDFDTYYNQFMTYYNSHATAENDNSDNELTGVEFSNPNNPSSKYAWGKRDSDGETIVIKDGKVDSNEFVSDGKFTYYCQADGTLVKGRLINHPDGQHKIYFDENGRMVTGWKKISNKWYYFDKNTGYMATGWFKADGKWYYSDVSGVMQTGWHKDGKSWYYFKSSGAMATGWQKVGGTWYYFKSSGAMATGWQKVGGTWYYFKSSGAMATGWQKVGGTYYFFFGSGAMASNEWADGYWLSKSGAWTYKAKGSWHQDSTGWWFGDSTGWYAASTTQKINGTNYHFNASGYWE